MINGQLLISFSVHSMALTDLSTQLVLDCWLLGRQSLPDTGPHTPTHTSVMSNLTRSRGQEPCVWKINSTRRLMTVGGRDMRKHKSAACGQLAEPTTCLQCIKSVNWSMYECIPDRLGQVVDSSNTDLFTVLSVCHD